MIKEKLIMLAGSIGGNVGNSGGSIGGNSKNSGGSIGGNSGNSDCIIVNSFNLKEHYVYIQEIRKWRDEVLIKSYMGKKIIKYYYRISPKLVKISKRIPSIKKPIKISAILIAKLV